MMYGLNQLQRYLKIHLYNKRDGNISLYQVSRNIKIHFKAQLRKKLQMFSSKPLKSNFSSCHNFSVKFTLFTGDTGANIVFYYIITFYIYTRSKHVRL